MTDFERGQETCNCAGSNLFLCDMPTVMQERLAFRSLVGGQPTEIFPVGEVLRHPNTVEGTRDRLEIVAAGMRRSTLMEDLSVGTPLVPEDLRTYVGVREVVEPPADPRREMLEAMIAHPDTVETMRQAYIMSLRQMDLDDQARMRSEFERAGGNGEGLFVIGLQFSTSITSLLIKPSPCPKNWGAHLASISVMCILFTPLWVGQSGKKL